MDTSKQFSLNQLVRGSNPLGVTTNEECCEKRSFFISPDHAPKFIQDDNMALASVVTLPAACHLWQRNRKTILMAIWKDELKAIQQGKTYLISVASLYRRWGAPINKKPGHK
jgi:hypothetical protein